MLKAIKDFIKDIKDIVEIMALVKVIKESVGKEISEQLTTLKASIEATPNELDDKVIPLLDKIIDFCK